MQNKLVLFLFFIALGFPLNFVANEKASRISLQDDNKKSILLLLKSKDDGENVNSLDETNSGRSLNNTQIFAELYNGVLSFSPYNIIGETFVLRIYDKEEEDVLWQKVCRYSELNNIILPNLPADTYVMTFETNEGVFATDIAL